MTRIRNTVAVAALALLALPASSMATTKFGAKLTPDVQPSNASQPHSCDEPEETTGPCTRVLMDAYGRPDQPTAPKNGKIKRIRLIAGAPGTFQLQIVKAKASTKQAKLVRNGPVFSYQGQDYTDPETDPEAYKIESFKVNVPVKKGQSLAIKSSSTSMLRCSSGGPNQLIFTSPLSLGSPFRTATDTDGCWLLLEAVMK
jgi:hypothetical protein